MRSKLRQVREKLSKKRRASTAVDATTSDAAETESHPSFLGLAPEIRNQIYEYLAQDTILRLSCSKPRKPNPPIGLLVACRQTWHEYRTLLLTQAEIHLSVIEYNFSNILRVFERLCESDLEALKNNPAIFILIQLSHVPTRDDRRALKAWSDYRDNNHLGPYFGTGCRLPKDLVFQYCARFVNNMRPPRPMSRYTNGYQMKLDLLRTHIRMATRLEQLDKEATNEELKRIKLDLEDRAKLYEDLAHEVPGVSFGAGRNMSIASTASTASTASAASDISVASTASAASTATTATAVAVPSTISEANETETMA